VNRWHCVPRARAPNEPAQEVGQSLGGTWLTGAAEPHRKQRADAGPTAIRGRNVMQVMEFARAGWSGPFGTPERGAREASTPVDEAIVVEGLRARTTGRS